MSNRHKAEETAIAVRGVNETTAAMATVDGADRSDVRGKEGIDSSDVVLPFLAICQKTSPQLESDSPKYIEGVKFLDLFNSLTSEVYEQPVEFIPLVLNKHAIEFNPFEDGGGIKDRNVRWDDPRCEFNGDDKPTATRFYDWAVLLVPSMELIVLSFKSTNMTVAKQLNQFIQMRQGPAFAGKYKVKVIGASNQYGKFGKLSVQPAGKPDQDAYDYAAQVYASIQGKNLVVDHEQDHPEAGTKEGQIVDDEKVPF